MLRPMTEPRTGQAGDKLDRAAFGERFRHDNFYDPAFQVEKDAIARLEAIAWEAYRQSRKSPVTAKAGDGFADPDYDLSVEWRATRDKLLLAQERWSAPATQGRVLLVNGSARNDGSCPSEISKSWRLSRIARDAVEAAGLQADLLDLSVVTSEYGRNIRPCKGCASTAMPLCHWPCSCYPNHSLAQADDWMGEIYERWVSAHGVIIIAPTYWYQSPTPLKAMIDRLVCADGGNPDPTSTHGKKAAEAKAIEEKGWNYPKHLEGRVYGVAVHGDVAGIESHRRNLSDWLDWMGLVDAGHFSHLDRYIGYYEPYFNSHETLDKDTAVQEEIRNVARSVSMAVQQLRAGTLSMPVKGLKPARTK